MMKYYSTKKGLNDDQSDGGSIKLVFPWRNRFEAVTVGRKKPPALDYLELNYQR